MKLLPYSNIKSDNLKILLFTSRALSVLSYMVFIASIIFVIFALLTGTINYTLDGEMSGISVSTETAYGPAIMILMIGTVIGFCLSMLSGFCAAVVSCEYKYTKTNENYS